MIHAAKMFTAQVESFELSFASPPIRTKRLVILQQFSLNCQKFVNKAACIRSLNLEILVQYMEKVRKVLKLRFVDALHLRDNFRSANLKFFEPSLSQVQIGCLFYPNP